MHMLTPEQIDAFHRNGWMKLPRFIHGRELELLQAATAPIVAEGVANQGPRHLRKMCPDGVERYWRSEDLWLRHPVFGAVTVNPALLQVVGQLLGQPFEPWGESLVVKPPQDPGIVAWHQDPTGSSAPLPSPLFTVDIYLDRSDHGNGCVHLIPGRHLVGSVDLGRDRDALFDHPEAVAAEMEPGDVLLHALTTPHGSRGNPSDRLRRTFYLAFMPIGWREIFPEPAWWDELDKPRAASTQLLRQRGWRAARETLGLGGDFSHIDLEHPGGIAIQGLPMTPPRHWATLHEALSIEQRTALRTLQP